MNLETATKLVLEKQTDKSVWEYVAELRLDAALAYETITKFAEPDVVLGATFPPEMHAAWATLNARIYALRSMYEAAEQFPHDTLTRATADAVAYREPALEKIKLVQSWYALG